MCGAARARFREMMSGIMVVSFFGLHGLSAGSRHRPVYTLRNQYTVPLQPFDLDA